MPFVKLDCGILDSSLWPEKDCRDMFLTALLMAVPREMELPSAQICIRELKQAGWEAPPGWYGFVGAASTGIIHRCAIDLEKGLIALEKLGSPDPESRTADHDGRRMIRIDGGFLILNYFRFRDRDTTAAARMRKWRQKQSDVTACYRNVTQAEAEAEAEEEKKKPRAPRAKPTDEEFWYALKPLYPTIDLAAERRKMQAWLLTPKGKGRSMTRGFVVNWLNRIDVPMSANGAHPSPPPAPDNIPINSVAQADSVLREIEAEIARITNAPGSKVQRWQPSPHMALTDEARTKIAALRTRRDTLRNQKIGMK